MTLTSNAPESGGSTRSKMTWYEEFYAGQDAKDLSVVDRFCTPDTGMQFANETPVRGRAAVREVMAGFWATIASMHHTFTNVFEDGDQTLIEADVTYTRLDGSAVLIKAGTVVRRQNGLVADQHVYVDLAPLASGRVDSADI